MKKLLVSVIALFGAVSLSAQDVTAIYNEAAAAFGAKNFTEASQVKTMILRLLNFSF